MKTICVYADFDWLTTPMLVGELGYESLRGSDSYAFKFEDLPEDWKCPRCRQGKEKFNRA